MVAELRGKPRAQSSCPAGQMGCLLLSGFTKVLGRQAGREGWLGDRGVESFGSCSHEQLRAVGGQDWAHLPPCGQHLAEAEDTSPNAHQRWTICTDAYWVSTMDIFLPSLDGEIPTSHGQQDRLSHGTLSTQLFIYWCFLWQPQRQQDAGALWALG
jgi:hypothetical protein